MALMETKKIALIMEYDGTRYHGFQIQASAPTIQGETECALRKITGERVRISSASRTDRGVHAKGQLVAFRTASLLSPETFLRALNHYLPEDIGVRHAFWVRDDFVLFKVRSTIPKPAGSEAPAIYLPASGKEFSNKGHQEE